MGVVLFSLFYSLLQTLQYHHIQNLHHHYFCLSLSPLHLIFFFFHFFLHYHPCCTHFKTTCIISASVTITLLKQNELLQEPADHRRIWEMGVSSPHPHKTWKSSFPRAANQHASCLWLHTDIAPVSSITVPVSAPVRFMAAVTARGRPSSSPTTSPLLAPELLQPGKRHFQT